MKKTVFLLSFLFYTSYLWSQDVNKQTMVFDTTIYDFGQLYKGNNAECIFTFYNKGSIPLLISDVKASCGCTVPIWTKEPVKPGGSGTVKVKYNTNTVGVFSKTITVKANDGILVTLTIKGEVKKK